MKIGIKYYMTVSVHEVLMQVARIDRNLYETVGKMFVTAVDLGDSEGSLYSIGRMTTVLRKYDKLVPLVEELEKLEKNQNLLGTPLYVIF
jgi:hypothetical protein